MKCFLPFKDKSKSKQKAESAPELRNRPNKSGDGGLDRDIKSTRSLPSPRSIPELYKEKEHTLRVFSFQELREATNGFSRLLKIGEGGFGSVYKGTIRPANGFGDASVVAIKRLNQHSLQKNLIFVGFHLLPQKWYRMNEMKIVGPNASRLWTKECYRFVDVLSPIIQGHKEWLAEVQFLGVLSHPNLVKLIGYCSVDGERGIQRLLVYEFMPNKSLEDHLFNKALPTLPWIKRLQIILDAAEGLVYLHEGLERQVIYRDFKSSNVLLDEKFQPKLSDFGLAREGPTGDRTHVSTTVVGTYGYAAPEYIETGHLTIHSDIWSFGVVLYEIITGRRVLERNRPTAEQKLLDWVRQFPADSKRFSMIIDPRLRNEFSPSAARRVAKLADRCLNKNAKDRPTMGQIVESLMLAIQESEAKSSPTNGKSPSPRSNLVKGKSK